MNKKNSVNKQTRMPAKLAAKSNNAHQMAAIVLAAGESQRMGEPNKLLMKVGEQSFLQLAVSTLCSAGIGEVVVVLGHDSEQTSLALRELPQVPDQAMRWVLNPDYAQGQMTSVNCGLASLSGSKDGILICLGDQPLINAVHIKQLIDAFENRQSGKQVIVPVFEAQRGNPVVISEFARQQVLDGKHRPGCRRFIDDNPTLVTMLPVADAAFTIDIDTPAQYQALIKKLGTCIDAG